MKYILLMYAAEGSGPNNPDELQAVGQAFHNLLKEASAAGVLLGQNGVAPGSSATTLRVRDGKQLITDGPFAETHEQMGGYFLLDCDNLDDAIEWAAKIPTAQYGSIEIRPLWTPE